VFGVETGSVEERNLYHFVQASQRNLQQHHLVMQLHLKKILEIELQLEKADISYATPVWKLMHLENVL
jgi:hypothetical protein